MTTTTKIFVILVCLFAFVFTPMAIGFAARTYDWRSLARLYQDAAESALAGERNALAVMTSEIEHSKSLRDQVEKRLLEARQQVNDLQQEQVELTTERDQLQRSRDSWQVSAERLTAEMAVINRHNQDLTTINESLTKSELDLRSRNNQLNDRLKDLSAEIVILKEQLRQAQEIATYRAKENEALRKGLGIGPGLEPPTSGTRPQIQPLTPRAPAEIRGEVVEVGPGIATVNVGASDGVTEGLVFVVLRGGEYVGDLVITSDIRPTEAAGRFDDKGKGTRIRPHDSVVDEYTFNKR